MLLSKIQANSAVHRVSSPAFQRAGVEPFTAGPDSSDFPPGSVKISRPGMDGAWLRFRGR
jgi:hypothetical protein